jgi:hypothetical protein
MKDVVFSLNLVLKYVRSSLNLHMKCQIGLRETGLRSAKLRHALTTCHVSIKERTEHAVVVLVLIRECSKISGHTEKRATGATGVQN